MFRPLLALIVVVAAVFGIDFLQDGDLDTPPAFALAGIAAGPPMWAGKRRSGIFGTSFVLGGEEYSMTDQDWSHHSEALVDASVETVMAARELGYQAMLVGPEERLVAAQHQIELLRGIEHLRGKAFRDGKPTPLAWRIYDRVGGRGLLMDSFLNRH